MPSAQPLSTRVPDRQPERVEWPTLLLIIGCGAAWAGALFALPHLSALIAALVLVPILVLHASLTHEVCHGHPLPSRGVSEALMVVNPGLAVPFFRFRDTHLAHHRDALLTDPYDDPESNFLDPTHWEQMSRWQRVVLRANNTLAGRMLIGPALGQISFMASDVAAIKGGDGAALRGWLWHLPGVALVLGAVWISALPIWVYVLSCYAALSILKIRTFLEHQAHALARGRTVIIEDRGILAFLFLNNSLHAVHHMHPLVPWYHLPALFREGRARYLACNDGYSYRTYGEIFRAYFLRAKDPVPHPLWRAR